MAIPRLLEERWAEYRKLMSNFREVEQNYKSDFVDMVYSILEFKEEILIKDTDTSEICSMVDSDTRICKGQVKRFYLDKEDAVRVDFASGETVYLDDVYSGDMPYLSDLIRETFNNK